MKLQEVRESALALPLRSRAKLATELIHSLEKGSSATSHSPEQIEAEWKEEIKRRMEAIDRGEMKLIPGEVVIKRLRARLK